jgi:hypothetical protein
MNLHREWRFDLCLCAAVMLFALAASAPAQDSARSSGWIAIPETEYQALRAKAFPVDPTPELPPVSSTLTRIDYDLRVNGDFAAGQASLTIDVIKDGWVRVPIPSTLLVREAKLDGKLVSLVSDVKGSSSKSVVFTHQGRAALLLDIVLPVTTTATNESISLPPAVAGITRASLLLPRQGVEIKLTGGFLAEKSASPSESKGVAYGRGNEPLMFAWWKKTEDHRSSQPLRMRGSLTQMVGLGEDTTSIQADVHAEIVQGAAQEIKIQIPDKVTINQVAGAMVADWETMSGELVVKFLEPIEKTARFVIAGETRAPREGKIDIPLLHLLNAERETGGVAIEVLGAGEIKDQKTVGLENADPADLGEIISNRQIPSLIAFRFRSGDNKATRSLAVDVARYQQEAVLMANIEEARYKILMSNEGKMLVQASYAIRNNQRNFLKIMLPQGAVVWSATLSGKPIRPGQAPDGGLLLPLEKARSGEEAPAFAAEILYFKRGDKWNDKGKLKLDLPVLDLPVSRTGLVYYYPSLFKVTPELGSFRTEAFQDPFSAALNKGSTASIASTSTGTVIGSDYLTNMPTTTNDVMSLVNLIGGVIPASDNPLFDANQQMLVGTMAPGIAVIRDGINVNEVRSDNNMNSVTDRAKKDTQALVDKYRVQSQTGKRAGILPISISFPAFGPSIFLVSELTAENQSPTVDISYEENRKGGAK